MYAEVRYLLYTRTSLTATHFGRPSEVCDYQWTVSPQLFSTDRGRQEALARWRLETAIAAPMMSESHSADSAPLKAGRVDLLELVLFEMLWRNKEERQVVLSVLTPTNSAYLRKASSSAKDPNRRLKQLQKKRTEWKKAPLEVRRRTRQDNQNVLKEGEKSTLENAHFPSPPLLSHLHQPWRFVGVRSERKVIPICKRPVR